MKKKARKVGNRFKSKGDSRGETEVQGEQKSPSLKSASKPEEKETNKLRNNNNKPLH